MKIRNGFVSNSSSSSFTCDVCGNTESGMDCGLSDFSMTQCINGHTFCDHHIKDASEEDSRYEYPAEKCPCCTFKEISDSDLIRYFWATTGKSKEDIKNDIKSKVNSYEEFLKTFKVEPK